MSLAYRKKNVSPLEIFGAYDDRQSVATIVKITPENSHLERRTNQAMKESCDINQILARFRKTGIIEHVAKYRPEYSKITHLDFEESFKTVKRARKMFQELPAEIRKNFHNEVENFLQFMENPENHSVEALMATTQSREPTTPPDGDKPTETTTTDSDGKKE